VNVLRHVPLANRSPELDEFPTRPADPRLRVGCDPMKHFLRPLFDRVVIKELEPERFRRSGLLVPAGTNEPPPQHGIVLAVGQGLDWWEHVGVTMPVKPGDHVVFPASAGVWIEVDEERLLVCRVAEILGVLEEARDPATATG
jgi:chaperonin GroES